MFISSLLEYSLIKPFDSISLSYINEIRNLKRLLSTSSSHIPSHFQIRTKSHLHYKHRLKCVRLHAPYLHHAFHHIQNHQFHGRDNISFTCSCNKGEAEKIDIHHSNFQMSEHFKRLHFIGIGGSGLSALASIAIQQGCFVTGSDLMESEKTKVLRKEGAIIHIGHSETNLFQTIHGEKVFPNAVVYSSAVKNENEELSSATSLNIPVFKRGEWLGYFTKFYDLIAIAGTHGKSTTSAMTSLCLRGLNKNINALIGADVIQFPDSGNAIVGDSKYFVLEADEYDNCFLNLKPKIALITNVEFEHVDIFLDEDDVRNSFKKFVQKIQPNGVLILCDENAGSKSLLSPNEIMEKKKRLNTNGENNEKNEKNNPFLNIITYGFSENSDFRATMLSPNIHKGTDFVVIYENEPITKVHLQVPGIHNVLNALAAIAVSVTVSLQTPNPNLTPNPNQRTNPPSDQLNNQTQNQTNEQTNNRTQNLAHLVSPPPSTIGLNQTDLFAIRQTANSVAKTLSEFKGIKRRFEHVGSLKNVEIFDDYAHHPTEIRATLQAAKQILQDKKIWIIFQPHTYSRLSKLLFDFAPCFSAADRVIVTQVYAAREENIWGVDGKTLSDAIVGVTSTYIPTQEEILERIKWELVEKKNGEMDEKMAIIIMGAGDITEIGPKLLELLA